MVTRGSLAILLLSSATPVWAQQVASDAAVALDEISVTAQHRFERAVDVPISLNVQTAADLEQRQIRRTEQAINEVPNAQMGTTSGSLYSNFTAIRGIGSGLIDTDPAVGLYKDGVPVGNSQGYAGGLLDVERIEVLRGPQGTLWGRNNLAGAINIISSVPVAGRTFGDAGIEFGRFNLLRGFGIVNLPIGDTGWAVRGALAASRNDGYTPNLAGGRDLNSLEDVHGRFTIKGDVTDKLELILGVESQSQRTYDAAFQRESDFRAGLDRVDILDPFNGTLNTTTARAQLTYKRDNGDRIVSITGFQDRNNQYRGNSFPRGYFAPLEAQYQAFGLAGFRYRTDNPFRGDYQQFSQEFRYISDHDERFKWLAGAYVEHSGSSSTYGLKSTFDPGGFLPGSSVSLSSTADLTTTIAAGFVDGSYALTDQLKLFAGARLGHDWKNIDYRFGVDNTTFAALGFTSAFASSYRDSLSETYVTPRAGLQFTVTPDLNVYTSVSQGFKSGGFNSAFVSPADRLPYESETVTTYEAGWKSSLFDNRMLLSGAAFFNDWRDQQVQVSNVATQSTPIQNARRSRSYGAEIEGRVLIDEHWSVRGGLGYVDATYVDFPNALATGRPVTIDASGNQQQYISKYSANIGATYTWVTGYDGLVGSADLWYNFRSGFFFDVENTLRQPAYGLLNAKLSFENERYVISLFGLNLTDTRYRSFSNDFGFGPLVAIAPPLMVGGSVRFKF
ncbi:TonB-dependent receptor [Methylorubrum zatmanii]